MTCPICDQKPMNCDCTETEKRQWAEIQDLRLTDAEREAIDKAAAAYARRCEDGVGLLNDGPKECGEIAATLRGLLERLG